MNFKIDDAFNLVYSRDLLLKKLKLQFWQFYQIPIMNTEVTFYVYYINQCTIKFRFRQKIDSRYRNVNRALLDSDAVIWELVIIDRVEECLYEYEELDESSFATGLDLSCSSDEFKRNLVFSEVDKANKSIVRFSKYEEE